MKISNKRVPYSKIVRAISVGVFSATVSLACSADKTDTVAKNVGTASNQGERGTAAELFDRNGKKVGAIAFSQVPAGVLIVANLTGISEGTYGFHIHEKGACDPKTGFKSAGGHLANGKLHGIKRTADHHPGDMANIHVNGAGTAVIEVLNTKVSLLESAADSGQVALLDADGSALMLHSGPDDYESQPGGAAGERMACAVINGRKLKS